MQKTDEKDIVSHLSKNFSVISQAWKMVELEYGTIDKWGLESTNTGMTDEEGNTIYNYSAQSVISERLRKHLNVSKVCETGKVCYNHPSYNLYGTKLSDPKPEGLGDSPADASFYLSDGTFVNIGWYNSQEHKVDISVTLPKKNVLGKTKYFFKVNKMGMYPEGAPKDVNAWARCNPDLDTSLGGRGCAAWVIYNKNMDYLHCRDELSWAGKRSCKE